MTEMPVHKDCLVIVQCRTSSTRLPAKAFLDVHGSPSVVICAKRLGNTGLPVLVATSSDITDDNLAILLEKEKISYFRGPLDNTLERFYLATKDLPEESIIVRMTADNLYPDGEFVEECLSQFDRGKISYASTMSSFYKELPYGMAAEIFTVKFLREAYKKAKTAHEKEHVTPYMRSNLKKENAIYFEHNYPESRCTMDTLEDYLNILEGFGGTNVLTESWRDLCEKHILLESEKQNTVSEKEKKQCDLHSFSLGTVQLGLPYGVSNVLGQPSDEDAYNILDEAWSMGVDNIDTASAYGISEKIIGYYNKKNPACGFKITTKLSPKAGIVEDVPTSEAIENAVRATVFRSLNNLKVDNLDYCLLHHWEDYKIFDQKIWMTLIKLKEKGYIKKLGTSVYNPDQAKEALKDDHIEFIQIPYNLLDRRWHECTFDVLVMKKKQLNPSFIVQARSIYLQGLLVSEITKPVKVDGFNQKLLFKDLDKFVHDFARISKQDLCLSYVRAQEWIDSFVIGAETTDQLKNNVELMEQTILSKKECILLEEAFTSVPEDLLNPAKWS